MKQVGPYLLQQELYGDDISRTFLAVDTRADQPVELLCFAVQAEQEIDLYLRVQRELQLIAALEDAPILPIETVGIDAGVCYAAGPALGGGPLDEASLPLPLEKSLYVARRVAAALDAVHALGLVHGDLKPEHVRFAADGAAYLGGFGRYKCLQAAAAQNPHLVAGALGYRAPEHDIRDAPAGAAADIYALGMLTFHMLGGQLPFRARTPLGWAAHHLLSPPPDVREWRPGIPAHVALAVQRALHKDPARRFASAGGFLAALENPAAASPPAAEKRPYWALHLERRTPRPPLWRRLALPGVMLLITLLLAVVALAPWLSVPRLDVLQTAAAPPPALALADGTPPTATPLPAGSRTAPAGTPTALPGGTAAPAAAASASAAATPSPAPTSPPASLLPSATPWQPSIPTLELSLPTPLGGGAYEIQYGDTLFDIASRLGVNLSYLMGINGMECSSRLYPGKSLTVPPAEIVTYPQPKGALTSRTIGQAAMLHTLECAGQAADVAFSPDQQLLAVAQENDILLWRLSDWKPVRRLAEHRRPVTRLRFSPDGRLLATGGVDGTLYIWQVSDGSVLWTGRAHRAEITDLAFSPDGAWLVSASLDRSVRVWSTADWQAAHQQDGYAAYSVAFSPDGALLAVGYSDRVLLLSLPGFTLARELAATSVPHNLAFSPDGLLLASNGDLWQVSDGLHIYQWPESTHRIAFTADGLALLVGRTVWSIPNGRQAAVLEFPLPVSERAAYAAESIAFSPDQRMLAIANQDGVAVMALTEAPPAASASAPTHRVQPGDTYFNVAAAHDAPLSDFLEANALTCENVPFVSQLVTLPPAQPPWGSGLRLLEADTFPALRSLRSLDMTCALPPGELRFSPASDALVSGLGMWKLAQGSLLVQGADRGQLPLDEETAMPGAVLRFSPDGSLVAEPNENRILLWSSLDGRFQRALEGHTGRVRALAFDMHGGVLASAGVDKTIRLWRVSDGALLDTIEGYTADELAFTPDGRILLSVAGDTARFWPVEINDLGEVQAAFLNKQSGEPLYTLQGLYWAYHLSPDGRYLGYVACQEGTVARCAQQVLNLYRLDRGVIAHTFYGVKESIQDFAFSPDGSQVAIATDNAVLLWDIEAETRLHQLIGERKLAEFVDALLYTPDNRYLLTVVNRSRLRFWDVLSGQAVAEVSIPEMRAVVLSPDQHLLAVLVGERISLWGVMEP